MVALVIMTDPRKPFGSGTSHPSEKVERINLGDIPENRNDVNFLNWSDCGVIVILLVGFVVLRAATEKTLSDGLKYGKLFFKNNENNFSSPYSTRKNPLPLLVRAGMISDSTRVASRVCGSVHSGTVIVYGCFPWWPKVTPIGALP